MRGRITCNRGSSQPDLETESAEESHESTDSSQDYAEADSGEDSEFELNERRPPRRYVRPPGWLNDYETGFVASIGEIPQNLNDLKGRADWSLWKQAIQEELSSLHENNTWSLVSEIPAG